MTQDRTQAGTSFLTWPVLFLLAAAILFAALGVWQVKRLAWKEALIARVEQRVDAVPVGVPGQAASRATSLPDLEYLRVQVNGIYVPSGTALTQAVTERGPGYWVLTPLKLVDGRLLYINRGYVPIGSKLDAVRADTPSGQVTIVGLLRLSEPKGGFLRSNDPSQDRWYSRDVDALAQARAIGAVAPFFIDVQRESPAVAHPSPRAPIGGLTVVHFPNSHLAYALTWFTMMILSLLLAYWIGRRGGAE